MGWGLEQLAEIQLSIWRGMKLEGYNQQSGKIRQKGLTLVGPAAAVRPISPGMASYIAHQRTLNQDRDLERKGIVI